MPWWRNWQTHTLQVRTRQLMRVQVPPTAQNMSEIFKKEIKIGPDRTNKEEHPPFGFEDLKKETKILDKEGNPLLMYNRSHKDFENFELNNRNLSNKEGKNKFGFFFSSNNNLEHYGKFVKARYLNIKNPLDLRNLGFRTEYKSFREELIKLGISSKELAGYDLAFQEHNIKRNKKMGSRTGLYFPGSDFLQPINENRMATFNFFDVGEGQYLRRLLMSKGIDGVLFEDEGEFTAVAFESRQIINPELLER